MNNYDNDTKQAPNANDFLGGNYLRKEDLDGPVTVTVVEVRSEEVRDSTRKKLVACFREFEKPLILNKTNIRRLAQIFCTGDTAAWRGPLTLFVDPGVEFGGRIVGGIRVRPAMGAETRADSNKQPAVANGYAQANGRTESEVESL